ncbi:MAG TPA: hypothetical protein VF659_10950 [Pyrinomonadaceae bacterium]|jgi:DNA-directed RNA polymerase specialized sigma24 family protein
MSENGTNEEENFNRLLAWLDPDREAAGERYEAIRRGLVKMFACRGCYEAEDLAGKTLDRVASKSEKVVAEYGPGDDPALYIYAVGKYVYQEWLREKRRAAPEPPPEAAGHDEVRLACLDGCLERLPPEGRGLVVEYYRDSGRARIEHRQEVARRLGIGMNALRIRACNLRASLRRCVADCVARAAAAG